METRMNLPTDAQERKDVPVFTGFIKYFPKAMVAVTRLSLKGNKQHHPDAPLHWDKSKSTDELDCLVRHLIEAGTYDTDGVLHDVKVAWRAMANLERVLDKGIDSVEVKKTIYHNHLKWPDDLLLAKGGDILWGKGIATRNNPYGDIIE
jgi:hypothetical protein